MYRESGAMKRLLAFFIDNAILFFIMNFLIIVLTPMFGFQNIAVPQALVDFTASAEFNVQGLLDLINNNKEVAIFFDTILPFMYTLLFVMLLAYVAYFVIVPTYFKDYQTLGRFVTKTNVVDNEGYLVGFKANFLRLLGDFLVILLTSFLGIGIALNVFFVLTRNRTIGDMFARTKFIDLTKPIEAIVVEVPNNDETNDNNDTNVQM